MSIRKQYDTDLESLKESLPEMAAALPMPWRTFWKRSASLTPMQLRPA